MLADEIVSAVRRSEQARCQQISQWESLEFGTAFTSSEFGNLPEANQLRDAWLAGGDAEKTYADVERFYASRGLTCGLWTPASGQAGEEVAALLLPKGWRRRELVALGLRPGSSAADEHAAVRILPARAMRRAYAQLLGGEPGATSRSVEAGFRRLDDSHFEAFVAMEGSTPVGRVAYLEVGETARLADFFVARGAAGFDRVRNALMAHFLRIAARLLPRFVVACAAAEDAAMISLLEGCGFVVAGRLEQFERAGP